MKVVLISGKAQSGKDTSANILKECMEKDNKKVLIAHYADLLKYICKTFFGWDGNKDEIGRTLLQIVGTDTIRKQNPDYWVNFLGELISMFENNWDYVIIPDTRFPNEIEVMRYYDYDVFSLRINRIDFESHLTNEQKKHHSETALDDYEFDYVISSSGLDVLKSELEYMYREELK